MDYWPFSMRQLVLFMFYSLSNVPFIFYKLSHVSYQNAPSITETNSQTFRPALRGEGFSEGGGSPLIALHKADIMPHSSG